MKQFNPDIHHRRSIRLKNYDYANGGAYFVTLCTRNGECLFGEIVEGSMRLNDAGRIVADEWLKTSSIRSEIQLDGWVVMPNHFHGVLVIVDGGSMQDGRPPIMGRPPVAPTVGPKPGSVGAVMAGFKSSVTKRITRLYEIPGGKLWQRNYYYSDKFS